MKFARRVDATHAAIRTALRSAGWTVEDMSRTGSGFPDLLVHSMHRVVLVEVKSPRNKSGTVQKHQVQATQTAFADRWHGGPIVTATDPAQAVAAVSAAFRSML